MSQEPLTPSADVQLLQALTSGLDKDVPELYFNGFGLGRGTGDVTMVLRKNSEVVAVLNCSFTVAKTLSQLLGQAIADLEHAADKTFLTTLEVAALGDTKDKSKGA